VADVTAEDSQATAAADSQMTVVDVNTEDSQATVAELDSAQPVFACACPCLTVLTRVCLCLPVLDSAYPCLPVLARA